jgi:aryl-alcohol dehydrogenase-like predicted oxidoreductase
MQFLDRDASLFSLGSVQFGTLTDEEASFELLDAYVRMGGNFIDTARVYGDFDKGIIGLSEAVIGKWLAQRGGRKDIIISTKGAHPPTSDVFESRMTRENIVSDCEDSLKALGTDYIDIYFLHRDDKKKPVSEIIDALNALVKDGKVLSLGVSNWTTERLLAANAYALQSGQRGFAISQPQWSLARQINKEDLTLVQVDRSVYDYHKSTGMPLMAYTSLAKGFYSKYNRGGLAALSEKAKTRYYDDDNLRIYWKLVDYSSRLNKSVTSLSLAYLTSQPFPVWPIVSASSLAQLQDLEEAGDTVLPDPFVKELNAMKGYQ